MLLEKLSAASGVIPFSENTQYDKTFPTIQKITHNGEDVDEQDGAQRFALGEGNIHREKEHGTFAYVQTRQPRCDLLKQAPRE